MNQRDLPEVVAELIYEMHEVRSELKAINGRVGRLEQTMTQVVEEQRGMREEQRGMREEVRALPDQIGTSLMRALEPFLNRLLEHDDQLRSHDGRLTNLENPSA